MFKSVTIIINNDNINTHETIKLLNKSDGQIRGAFIHLYHVKQVLTNNYYIFFTLKSPQLAAW